VTYDFESWRTTVLCLFRLNMSSDKAPTNKIYRQVSNAHERDLVTNQNVLIRDKISFVGVAHLTRGGRSCSWALYRLLNTERRERLDISN